MKNGKKKPAEKPIELRKHQQEFVERMNELIASGEISIQAYAGAGKANWDVDLPEDPEDETPEEGAPSGP